MKANYEDKIPKKTSEVSLGNLYDMNKQLMANEASISEEKLKEKKQALGDWISKLTYQHYFMMLCHERRDYTLFNMQYNELGDITVDQVCTMIDDVIECMTNRGTLLTMDLQEDGAWELWIRHATDGECSAYYLFPYGSAVLEY